MVGTVLDRLQQEGEQDTLVVYMGDNGFQWGEHGLVDKSFPYTESVNVPLVVRYPPVTIPDSTDSRLVQNIDLTPTALKIANLTTNRNPPLDGLSLFDPINSRSRLLFEYENHFAYPNTDPFRNWASTRTATYQYIESYEEDGVTVAFREYYDLVNDPDERFNLYGPDGQPYQATTSARRRSRPRTSPRSSASTACARGPSVRPGPGAPPAATDTQAPSVEVSEPTASSYVCCRVKLMAKALDNLGVSGVHSEVDGRPSAPRSQRIRSRLSDTSGVSRAST